MRSGEAARPIGIGITAGVGIALLLAATASARADAVEALYVATWAGLPAAEIRVAMRDDAGAYRNEIEIRSEGLPNLITNFRSNASAEGRLTPGGAPQPVRYNAIYDLRKRRDRHLSMQFVSRNGAVYAERASDDTSRKPPLDDNFRKNVIDPLSALAMIREELRRRNRTAFTIPTYDGARRFDVAARILPKRGQADGALHLILTLRPIAGFKGESSEDGDPNDSPREVELSMTDDARLLPLSMTVSVAYLPLVIQLSRVCTATSACPHLPN